MFSTSSLVTLALVGIAATNSVAAVPTAEPVKVYPEVIPGPGLPTLAELGLTSEQLYTYNSTRSNGKFVSAKTILSFML